MKHGIVVPYTRTNNFEEVKSNGMHSVQRMGGSPPPHPKEENFDLVFCDISMKLGIVVSDTCRSELTRRQSSVHA